MMLIAPGSASMRPTVPTMPSSGCSRAIASSASAISAAPASASWRSVIGTVPACPASPVTVTRSAALPDDAGDDAERLVLRLQHRALLDMHLDIAGGVLAAVGRGRNLGGVLAIGLERVAQA